MHQPTNKWVCLKLLTWFLSYLDPELQFRKTVQTSSRQTRQESKGATVLVHRGGVPTVPEGILWQNCRGEMRHTQRQRYSSLSVSTNVLCYMDQSGFLHQVIFRKSLEVTSWPKCFLWTEWSEIHHVKLLLQYRWIKLCIHKTVVIFENILQKHVELICLAFTILTVFISCVVQPWNN